MRSACWSVESRCETRKTVRAPPRPHGLEDPLLGLRVDGRERVVEDEDRARPTRSARARAMRCFCPPESVMPRSPTIVSRPFGKRRDVGPETGLERGASTSAAVAPGRPNATFAASVSEKRNVSCGTTATLSAGAGAASRAGRARRGGPTPNGGSSSAEEEVQEGRLPGARAPDERRPSSRAPR